MDKKNILITIPSMRHGGGAEKVAAIIGTKLHEEGYNIKYFTFYNTKNKYRFKGKEFCLNETGSSNIFINIFKLFKRAYKIKKYCKKNNIDTCLSHMEEGNFSNILSKILFGNKSKIYVQIHISIDTWGWLYKLFIKLFYNRADKIIAIVKEGKQNLVKNYKINSDIVEVIYNPLDTKNINKLKTEKIEKKYGKLFTNHFFSFINIGRLSNQKNQKTLLRVFNKINLKYPDTQLIILGDGPLKGSLSNKREHLKSKKNIYMLGNQKNPYKFLYHSDCFVLSSKWEGFPVVIEEAMCCGLPIISTDCKTGPKEILKKQTINFTEVTSLSIEEYGILVPINNEKILFNAMEKIYLNKPLREKYIKKSLEKSQEFDIIKIIKLWKKIL